MTMPKQLLAFILCLLICLLSSNINTEARRTAAAKEGNQVGRFLLFSLNSMPVSPKLPSHEQFQLPSLNSVPVSPVLPDHERFLLPSLNIVPLSPKLPDHEHDRALTSHQARNTPFLYHQAVQAPPSSGNSTLPQACEGQQPTWCIAKPLTDEQRLLANIDYNCNQAGIDCSIIQPGGKCYLPDNNYVHASVVMNLYYKANNKQPHTCYFMQSGLIISEDPSFGDCTYPS
ncbi:hypothetical protein Ddye_022150 [Dipteronia dyeriana]|uniref:X8 domain-containing protein n=1 Tax=Dipteronia dyeriana TaxID=168575 RepID=A0AAD9U2Y7_9ROSI|nr:hypothetical protein Ddye_022150 [Dipteronia dyeriana]